MKTLKYLLLFLSLGAMAFTVPADNAKMSKKEMVRKCWGKIYVKKAGKPDFAVAKRPGADLRVCLADFQATADGVGKWFFVNSPSDADWTINFVECDWDFTIEFVSWGHEGPTI